MKAVVVRRLTDKIRYESRVRAVRLAFRPRDERLRRFGSAYGGWYLPTIDPSWVCFTAGVGEDASFDVALAEAGCQVVAIDPTPRAIEYVTPLVTRYPTLELAPYALWTEATQLPFFPPADANNVSHSLTNLQQTHDPIFVEAKTLATIVRESGHDHADLLKLDIEGAEYPVLDATDLDALGVQIMCIEFHFDQRGLGGMVRAVRRLERRGFRVAHVSDTDFTLVRR